MTLPWNEFIELTLTHKHHAIFLSHASFAKTGLSAPYFRELAAKLCGIILPNEPDDEIFWAEKTLHPDLFIVDRQRPILRLEEISQIQERLFYEPVVAKRRLIFIDRVSRLNISAANALLKNLEEPSTRCVFVLTDRSDKAILPTIASRCLKWAVSWPEQQFTNVLADVDAPDLQLLQILMNFPAGQNPPISDSLWNPRPQTLPPKTLQEILGLANRLSKAHDPAALRDILRAVLANAAKNSCLTPTVMRACMQDIRTWEQTHAFHPQSALSVTRFLCRIRQS